MHRNPEMPKMVTVHVTHDETKRILSLQKGENIQGLRHIFLQLYSDVLSSDIAPAHVKFQRYDEKFEDYVEIPNDEKVDDDMKVRALVKQVLLVFVLEIFDIIRSHVGAYHKSRLARRSGGYG